MHGLKIAFTASFCLFVLAAIASWLRGGRYIHQEETAVDADKTKSEKELVGAN